MKPKGSRKVSLYAAIKAVNKAARLSWGIQYGSPLYDEKVEDILHGLQVSAKTRPSLFQSPWMSANKLPKKVGTYLVVTNTGDVRLARYFPKHNFWDVTGVPKFWMPIPAQPKKGAKS